MRSTIIRSESRIQSYLAWILPSSFYSRVYTYGPREIRFDNSSLFSVFLPFVPRTIVRTFVEWTKRLYPLSRSRAFLSSRNKSYVFAYKRPFNITTLDLPPQNAHLRVREAESQAPRMFRWHLSSGQPGDPKRHECPLAFPWFSSSPVSIWLDDSRFLRQDYHFCQRIIACTWKNWRLKADLINSNKCLQIFVYRATNRM